MYKAGQIILTPFPFTDLSGNKVRPALVLGFQNKSDDITVCFISSNLEKRIQKFDILLDSKEEGFQTTGLKVKSIIKTSKIATLDRIVVLGVIGQLDSKNMQKVKNVLKIYFKL